MTKTADALGGFLLYNVCMSDKIKRVKITELQPDPNNLNQHTQRGHTIVENSMRRRGIGRGILAAGKGVDNPVVLAGNLTLEKAVDAGFENVILVHTRHCLRPLRRQWHGAHCLRKPKPRLSHD